MSETIPQLLSKFISDGYVLLKSEVDAEKIEALKWIIIERHRNKRLLQGADLLKVPGVEALLFDGKVVALLKSIYGKVTYFPSTHSQYNSFTQKKAGSKSRGLHIDGSEELELKCSYMNGIIPPWVNIGFYFQDAHNGGYGGGIAALKGSHKAIRALQKFFPRSSGRIFKWIMKILERLLPDALIPNVDTKKGDIIVFDNRLLHCSIPGEKIATKFTATADRGQSFISDIPIMHSKLAIYWFAGDAKLKKTIVKNNFEARVMNAAAYGGGFDYSRAVTDVESRYSDYPSSYVTAAMQCDIELA
jgi:hypothetical protein